MGQKIRDKSVLMEFAKSDQKPNLSLKYSSSLHRKSNCKFSNCKSFKPSLDV